MAAGIIREAPTEIVKNHGVLMYKGILTIPKSGGKTEYCIPYQIRIDMLKKSHIGISLLFSGEFRSRNDKTSGRLQLRLYFHIKDILPLKEDKCINDVCLVGFLCDKPYFKSKRINNKEPLSITSATIAVHRPEQVTDYIPCAFYGSLAYQLKTAEVGSQYLLTGRMVNRNYFVMEKTELPMNCKSVGQSFLLSRPQ